MPLDDYAVDAQHISTGMLILKKRQRKLYLLYLLSLIVLMTSFILYVVQHEFIYSFFGLNTEVKQLHVPYGVDSRLAALQEQKDYFFKTLEWVLWLFIKTICAFWGAFLLIYLLNKMNFFAFKFKSLLLKLLSWITIFLLIWAGLTYLQIQLRTEKEKSYSQAIQYELDVEESEIANYLKDSQVALPIKHYLLAQTVLLHNPADLEAAKRFVDALIRAEKFDPKFKTYGFKPEQLWIMQYQVYGKTASKLGESVAQQAQQAEKLKKILNILILTALVISSLSSIILYILAYRLDGRLKRIAQNMN